MVGELGREALEGRGEVFLFLILLMRAERPKGVLLLVRDNKNIQIQPTNTHKPVEEDWVGRFDRGEVGGGVSECERPLLSNVSSSCSPESPFWAVLGSALLIIVSIYQHLFSLFFSSSPLPKPFSY